MDFFALNSRWALQGYMAPGEIKGHCNYRKGFSLWMVVSLGFTAGIIRKGDDSILCIYTTTPDLLPDSNGLIFLLFLECDINLLRPDFFSLGARLCREWLLPGKLKCVNCSFCSEKIAQNPEFTFSIIIFLHSNNSYLASLVCHPSLSLNSRFPV